ncbi:topology modulation protein [Halobacillus yeomjeoni]|uniref:Topology modulation protein n=1 Tax=Halobacillus yeomjeoni TaxID=311194 RepID=A0A931HYG8_9BACI|nr:topology modulation protein [Halobacillus yeomjeoni]MBH0231713.1 topology modulation protein [Halobacillus yeomjeoni]
MKRIMVVGISAGVGKSTFAKELGELLNIDVYHLDRFFWKPGWNQASLEEFSQRQKEVAVEENWIIEGNYRTTIDIRIRRADTLIYLELPLLTCLYRVFKRWWKNRGGTRWDLGEGCEEKLDFDFLKFIITTYYPRKKKMRKLMDEFQEGASERKVIVLKGKKEIHSFLERIRLQSDDEEYAGNEVRSK